MRSFVLLLCVILLLSSGVQPSQAQQFSSLSKEGSTHGIDFSYAQASYNEERAGFEINRIIPLVQEPRSINRVKFFIGASREGTEAESWNFRADEYPVEWHVLVDVSKSMSDRLRSDPAAVTKGARAAKALEIVRDMLTRCPAQDRIIIHFFSTNFEQVADIAPGDSRTAAESALTPQKVQEVAAVNYNGDNTTLYPLLARYIDSKLADRRQETHRAMVLITDGIDESANQHEHWENARRSLAEKGIRMNVYLIAPPANGTVGDHEVATLTGNLAPETGGTCRLIKNLREPESTAPMVALEHAGSGTFFLPLKREAIDALTIQFLHGDQLQAAVEWTKEAALATAGPAPRSAEDIAAEEARRQAAEKYRELPALLTNTETALTTLSGQEEAHAPKADLKKAAEAVRTAADELVTGLESVKAFALQDYTVLSAALEDETANAKLQELLRLHPLTAESVWTALGRTAPLVAEEPPPVVIKKTAPKLYFWVAGLGIALAVPVCILYAVRLRRLKREQAEWQNKINSIKTKAPAPPRPVYGSLVCLQTGQEWPVHKEAITIGRTEDNDIILNDSGVSGHHCVLKKNRDGAWVLNDLGSNNGIFCQGRVFTTLNMLPEVSFILGRTELMFRPKE